MGLSGHESGRNQVPRSASIPSNEFTGNTAWFGVSGSDSVVGVVSVESDFKVVVKDQKDDMIINTACDGHAVVIVTGTTICSNWEVSKESR